MRRVFLFGLVVIGLCLSSCSGANSPSDVVKDFYKYAAAGKVNEAFELFSKEGQGILKQYAGGTASIADLTKKINEKGGVKAIEIQSEEIIGDTATVKYLIRFGNGSTKQDNEKPIKEGGKWKLSVSK
jgi:hypothetical protein